MHGTNLLTPVERWPASPVHRGLLGKILATMCLVGTALLVFLPLTVSVSCEAPSAPDEPPTATQQQTLEANPRNDVTHESDAAHGAHPGTDAGAGSAQLEAEAEGTEAKVAEPDAGIAASEHRLDTTHEPQASGPAKAPPTSCTTNADCSNAGPSMFCDRPEGCTKQGVCRRSGTRKCGKAITCFEDCAGTRFQSSTTCPGRPVKRRISCEIMVRMQLGATRISSTGARDPKAEQRAKRGVVTMFRRAQRTIEPCFAKAQDGDSPTNLAKVLIEFTLGSDGKVTNPKIVSDSSSGVAGRCVLNALRRQRGPMPSNPKGGEIVVRQAVQLR